MKHKRLCLSLGFMLLLTGCANTSAHEVTPLMELEWFSEMSEVKSQLHNYELLNERQDSEGTVQQDFLDYTGTDLFEVNCDLTLCFTSQGLIGFNYHDIVKNNTYQEWFDKIETIYGVPTESGSGMASWYDNPIGKNTALYLFNLEEGVQISFYATSNTPDKSYAGTAENEFYIPTPELRTPVVPVSDESKPNVTGDTTIEVASSEGQTSVVSKEGTEQIERVPGQTEVREEGIGEATDEQANKIASGAAATSNATTQTTSAVTETVTETETESPIQEELQFYASPESEREKMSGYTQLYEYKTREAGQPWELMMEYENVPYCNKNCNAVLCFTSLGLVGINYFDADVSAYSEWISSLTEIYGNPSDLQDEYTVWSDNPLGEGTMVYLFALEDGVQISLFADDTGSELS
ncbi:MAG: hypothetical protein K2H89_08365 [Oscillospiraceae bacterium]|nr:hypothetical protein [Oscillospiraceae bacterium]